MNDLFKTVLRFISMLAAVSLLSLLLHARLTQLPINGILGGAYLLNTVTATIIFTVIVRLRERYSEQLGFVFLAGSGLKFLLFFLFMYPVFHADGALSRTEFATFFIPYSITTGIETIALASILNRL